MEGEEGGNSKALVCVAGIAKSHEERKWRKLINTTEKCWIRVGGLRKEGTASLQNKGQKSEGEERDEQANRQTNR